MIELTALDVRAKRGDFRRRLRGYDRAEVDGFIELVAERIEELTAECKSLDQKLAEMEIQVEDRAERERAINDALIAAQEMRNDVMDAAKRKAEITEREAELRGERIEEEARARARERIREAEEDVERARASVDRLIHRRSKLLRSIRRLLQEGMELVGEEAGPEPKSGDGEVVALGEQASIGVDDSIAEQAADRSGQATAESVTTSGDRGSGPSS